MDIKKLLHTLLLLLTVNGTLLAAQVTGKVIDQATKQAIDFANVSVLQGERMVTGTITDATGAFA